jgi:polynucleotide 5'-hydroxyl-kinase GRC3/NOL9
VLNVPRDLSSKCVLLVKGPAIICLEGKGWVLGKDVSNSRVLVNVGKILPFEKGSNCKIHCIGGESWLASCSFAGTSIWKDIVQRILFGVRILRTVLIIGNSDTGKSTFAVYLINEVLKKGFRPCIIDADIGQGDLAPPNTIGGAIITAQITDLRDVNPQSIEFVGSTNPTGFEEIIIKAVKKISREIGILSNIVIINTDGYVLRNGIDYKIGMAEEIKPDVVVCLGQYSVFQIFQRNFPSSIALYGKSVDAIKSKIDRKQRRSSQFLRYISGSDGNNAIVSIKMKETAFVYKGKTYQRSRLGRYGTLYLMNSNNIVHIQCKKLVRMFVGLGLNRNIVGFGIMNISRHSLYVESDVYKFDKVYLSNSAISEDDPSEFKIIDQCTF